MWFSATKDFIRELFGSKKLSQEVYEDTHDKMFKFIIKRIYDGYHYSVAQMLGNPGAFSGPSEENGIGFYKEFIQKNQTINYFFIGVKDWSIGDYLKNNDMTIEKAKRKQSKKVLKKFEREFMRLPYYQDLCRSIQDMINTQVQQQQMQAQQQYQPQVRQPQQLQGQMPVQQRPIQTQQPQQTYPQQQTQQQFYQTQQPQYAQYQQPAQQQPIQVQQVQPQIQAQQQSQVPQVQQVQAIVVHQPQPPQYGQPQIPVQELGCSQGQQMQQIFRGLEGGREQQPQYRQQQADETREMNQIFSGIQQTQYGQ